MALRPSSMAGAARQRAGDTAQVDVRQPTQVRVAGGVPVTSGGRHMMLAGPAHGSGRPGGLGAAHAGTRGVVVARVALAAGATCRRIAQCARRDGNDTQIGSGDTVRCSRRLGIVRRMGPGRHDTRVGCERAWGAEHVW
jgi:hypothetical protein